MEGFYQVCWCCLDNTDDSIQPEFCGDRVDLISRMQDWLEYSCSVLPQDSLVFVAGDGAVFGMKLGQQLSKTVGISMLYFQSCCCMSGIVLRSL